MPLGVVVLGLRKAIVQQQHRPALQFVGQGAHKSLSLGVHFGQVVVCALYVQWRGKRGRAVGPSPTLGLAVSTLLGRHPALVPHAADARQQLDRHGVQHFIAHHHTAHGVGQGAKPAHFGAKALQQRLLANLQTA